MSALKGTSAEVNQEPPGSPFQDLDPVEQSLQLRKPSGETGRRVAEALDESNREFYGLAFSLFDFKPGDRLLEIGFGGGKHFPLYFERQAELMVAGVDFSQVMCEEARRHNTSLIEEDRLEIHCADSSRLLIEDQAFDWGLGLNVLYFWDPPEPHLAEIRRVLKPGGELLLGFRPRHTVEHLDFTRQNFILYEPKEVRELLEVNGFEVVRKEVQSYEKKVPDGSLVEITDACMLARKEG